MLSELAATAAPLRVSVLGLLRSQGLGIFCGQVTVVLLGIGSVVLVTTADGASRGIAMDDIRGFFVEPSWAHAWFYALVPVMTVYGINTLLGTWDDFVPKWRAGVRAPRAYAATLVHLGFLVALVAHLVGGLFSADGRPFAIGPRFTDLGEGRAARVAELRLTHLPTGALEQAYATVEVRAADGSVTREVVTYNGPLSRGLGSELFLLVREGSEAHPAILVRPRYAPGNPLALVAAVLLATGTLFMWRRLV